MHRKSLFLWDNRYTSRHQRIVIPTFCRTINTVVKISVRDRSRTATTSKMERFVIIVSGFQSLTIITKRSILDVSAVLDPPLSVS